MALRSLLKTAKGIVRKNSLSDRIYLWLRYGTGHPLSGKYWDRIWRNEGLETWRTYPDKFDFILSLVMPGSRVLDVGCGVGVLLNRLRRERACTIRGVDLSHEAIRMARQTGVPAEVCRLPRLPFASGSFDVVTATEVIEHLAKPRVAIGEMCRVLRKEGTLILSTPDDCIPPDTCDEHLHSFQEGSLRELVSGYLTGVGVRVIECGDPFLVLWGKKDKEPISP